MPRSGASQRNPEMPKRSTATCQRSEEPLLTQKRSRSPPTDDPTRSGKTDNHVQKLPHRPWPDNPAGPSLGQNHAKQNGSSKRSSQELKEKSLGLLDAKQSTNASCVPDDTTSAGSIKTSVLNGASNCHSASSSASASNHDAKVASLQSKYADLAISPDGGSSKSRRQHEIISSPSQNSQEDSESKLPPELVQGVLSHMDWRTVSRLLSELGKACRYAVHQPVFLQGRPRVEAEFSPSYFVTDAEGDLHWRGFNTLTRKWESIPSLNFAKKTVLPSPDPDLFKDYLVAGDGGILCMNVGKSTGREELVVCNPLTRQVKVLPPLQHSRHPVLMHLKVDADGHYKIVVAGSAAIGTEDLSLKTEEYDSRTGKWECPPNSDMACAPFGLNEYQNGVYYTDSGKELLLCVAIIGTRGRGVLAYDLKTHTWMQALTRFHIPLVRSETNVGYLATTQIVECGGNVYVFSEQECGKEVFFLIYKLNFDGPEDQPWDEVLRRKRAGGRGLLVYPEFTCAVVSEHELCIFNTVEHTIELIDLNKPTEVAPLLPAPSSKANRFHSLNPIGFVYKPSFKNDVCPRGRDPTQLCEYYKPGKYCSECERRDPQSSRHMKVDSKKVESPAIPQPENPPISPDQPKNRSKRFSGSKKLGLGQSVVEYQGQAVISQM